MQRGAGYLGRINHAHRQHVAIFAGGGVVTVAALAFQHLVHDYRRLVTRVGDDGAQRRFHRAQHDGDTGILVVVVALQLGNRGLGAQQRHAAAGNDAFFNSGTGRMQRIFHARLLFLHFDFGRSTDFDHGHTASQLGFAFLQFFLVVVAGGFFRLLVDLGDTALDRVFLACAVDESGVVLAHFDAFGLTHFSQRGFFQRQADFFCDHGTAGQDGNIFQHGLAAVAEARSLDGDSLQDATDVVDHQRCQCFAIHIFGDDQQWAASLGDLFQQRQQIANVGDFFVVQQDERIVHQRELAILIIDEIGG